MRGGDHSPTGGPRPAAVDVTGGERRAARSRFASGVFVRLRAVALVKNDSVFRQPLLFVFTAPMMILVASSPRHAVMTPIAIRHVASQVVVLDRLLRRESRVEDGLEPPVARPELVSFVLLNLLVRLAMISR